MARDTPLGFPAHTLPYRCGNFASLFTDSNGEASLLPRFLYYTQCADFWLDRYRNSLEMETS